MPDTNPTAPDAAAAPMTAAETELAQLLVTALNLETVDPATVDPDAFLFGTPAPAGWGLDSIDALEIALAVQQKYGVEIRSEDPAVKEAFRSLRTLAGYVAARRGQH